MKTNIKKIELCWNCGGDGQVMCCQDESHPSGYEPCPACKGTGYGESLETMWKRKGITQSIDSKPEEGGGL